MNDVHIITHFFNLRNFFKLHLFHIFIFNVKYFIMYVIYISLKEVMLFMITLSLKLENTTPQYSLDKCFSCESLEGISYCEIKNRGCCFYYPKFSLLDLQKMCKTEEGISTISKILNNPGSKIYKYYIHCMGSFDENKYNNFLQNNLFTNEELTFPDKTIFFRTCPFVVAGEGCSIPAEFRTNVCNFFICKSIYKNLSECSAFKDYIKERNSYIRWCEWENEGLISLLNNEGVNLINNFDKSIEILKSQPLNIYDFSNLNPISINSSSSLAGAV